MQCVDSNSFFEVARNLDLENGIKGRILCLKDFFKKCLLLPFALVFKGLRTVSRFMGIILIINFLLLTLGSSASIRRLFIQSMSGFAKDLADWILLPLAFVGCFLRLLMALFLHPNIYFNAFA
jgi:hypothetical protein